MDMVATDTRISAAVMATDTGTAVIVGMDMRAIITDVVIPAIGMAMGIGMVTIGTDMATDIGGMAVGGPMALVHAGD